MRRAAPRSGIVLGLSLSLAACGPGDRPVVDDGLAWHADAERRFGSSTLFTTIEFVEVMLPEAAHGIPDMSRDPEVPTFFVNLLPDGTLHFKGNTYDLWGARAQEEWLGLLRELVAGPRWRNPDGTSRIVLALHGDRDVPWRHVVRSAAAWTDPALRFVDLDLFTWRHRRGPSRLRFRMSQFGAEGTGTFVIRLETIGADAGERDGMVRVRVGEAIVDVQPGLQAANEAWNRVRDLFRENLTAGEVAWVSATQDVPFGYVVTVLDLLVGAGAGAIELPETGARLAVDSANERIEQFGSWAPWDQSVSWGGVVVIFAAGLVLALHSTRRSRRR